MRHPILFSACIAGAMVLSACEKKSGDAAVQRAFQDVNVVDESNLNDVMQPTPAALTCNAGLPSL